MAMRKLTFSVRAAIDVASLFSGKMCCKPVPNWGTPGAKSPEYTIYLSAYAALKMKAELKADVKGII